MLCESHPGQTLITTSIIVPEMLKNDLANTFLSKESKQTGACEATVQLTARFSLMNRFHSSCLLSITLSSHLSQE